MGRPRAITGSASWAAAHVLRCRLRDSGDPIVVSDGASGREPTSTRVHLGDAGRVEVPVLRLDSMETRATVEGRAVEESTLPLYPSKGSGKMRRTSSRSLVTTPSSDLSAHALAKDRRDL